MSATILKPGVFVFAAIMCAAAAPSAASDTIRVAIADNQKNIVTTSSAGLLLEGRRSGHAERKLVFSAVSLGSTLARVRSADGIVRVNGRPYRGVIEVRKNKRGTLFVVNDLDIEDYLKGVVAEEMPSDWEPEALKAQAVIARSFALYQKKAAGRRSYHLGATVNGQVYTGVKGERPGAVQAVEETDGIVIAYGGRIIPAFFHSSCGGRTEDASELWGIDEPYLKGVDCDCQRISKYGVWEKRFTLDLIEKALRKRGYPVPALSSVRTGSITAAGRVREVETLTSGGTTTVPAEDLRRAMGYTEIPSVFFEISMSGRDVVFSGRGRGHGVGLCQWGAKWMAQQGLGYQSIIRHYYPGTRLALADEFM